MNKAEREWLNRVEELGCVICRGPAQIHHLLSRKRGMGTKASHYETIPVCFNHHVGRKGIHQIGRKTWEAKYDTEENFLQKILLTLKGNPNEHATNT